jgi:hypothetical protein
VATGKSINDMLVGAKSALKKADDFTKSVTGGAPSAFVPKHEYSQVPYSLVEKVKKVTGNSPATGEDVAAGLKAKIDTIKKVSQ